MDSTVQMKIIAHIVSPFHDKFGIPRQSGLAEEVISEIIFTPEYRVPEAVRGLEEFSHLWLIWQFSKAVREDWSPTVRPPRLGGNTRMGVFATRSPFRPNSIGLSCVKLCSVEMTGDGPVLRVSGADLLDGTPIFDIKPYIPYADCQPDATGGFTDHVGSYELEVLFPDELLSKISVEYRGALLSVLKHDPRPSYRKDSNRIYGMRFADYNIRFQISDQILKVVEVQPE